MKGLVEFKRQDQLGGLSGNKIKETFTKFRMALLFEFKWQDQLGDLSSNKIKETFTKFRMALLEQDDEKKLNRLENLAKDCQSFHAATFYCGLRFQTLVPTENFFFNKLIAIINWYLEVGVVHGSPAYYYLASICFQFSELVEKLIRKELLKMAISYVKAGLEIQDISVKSLFNAYLGADFSAMNLRFDSPGNLLQESLQCLSLFEDSKIILREIEKEKNIIIDRFYLKLTESRQINAISIPEL